MEYIDGKQLSNYWRGDLSTEEKKAVLRSFLEGIKEIINSGLFPGDLNTMNIMVDKQCRVRFVDLEGYVVIDQDGTEGSLEHGGAFSEIKIMCWIVSKLSGQDRNSSLLNVFIEKNQKNKKLTTEMIVELLSIIDDEIKKIDDSSILVAQ
jgi:predicted unusual protein kinase regulating ubiquinone biosynthesis (AarF/ABC1/UbiB family)